MGEFKATLASWKSVRFFSFFWLPVCGGRDVPRKITRTKKSSIALRLGAATVVIAMAIEPFAQLLVRYEQEIVFIPSNEVSIPFARRYSKGLEYHNELGLFCMEILYNRFL